MISHQLYYFLSLRFYDIKKFTKNRIFRFGCGRKMGGGGLKLSIVETFSCLNSTRTVSAPLPTWTIQKTKNHRCEKIWSLTYALICERFGYTSCRDSKMAPSANLIEMGQETQVVFVWIRTHHCHLTICTIHLPNANRQRTKHTTNNHIWMAQYMNLLRRKPGAPMKTYSIERDDRCN